MPEAFAEQEPDHQPAASTLDRQSLDAIGSNSPMPREFKMPVERDVVERVADFTLQRVDFLATVPMLP